MIYKLTVTVRDLQEEEIQKVMDLLKDYENRIEKMSLEKREEE